MNITGISGTNHAAGPVSRKKTTVSVWSGEERERFLQQLEEARRKKDSYVLDPLPDTRPTIPDADIRRWAEKYDPEHMSQDDYCDFVDDLVSAGVLEAGDKVYVQASDRSSPYGLTCHGTLQDIVQQGPVSYSWQAGQPGQFHSLADAKGNARLFAAGWKYIDGGAEGQRSNFLRRQVALFDKISWILDRMEAER